MMRIMIIPSISPYAIFLIGFDGLCDIGLFASTNEKDTVETKWLGVNAPMIRPTLFGTDFKIRLGLFTGYIFSKYK